MDDSTLERIAELICGDGSVPAPIYRSGSELSRFFQRADVERFQHDGSTRKWWTLDALRKCTGPELQKIILRLSSPKEYGGNPTNTKMAIDSLNSILRLEGLEVFLNGVTPQLKKIQPTIDNEPKKKLKPLPPPKFDLLSLDPGIPELLQARWEEASLCLQAKAFLASTIIMGSLLEGLLLGVLSRFPRKANESLSAPKYPGTDKVKLFHEWTLAEMIDVAHTEQWIDLDVKKFSHALREFRNLVHPYQQLAMKTFPDEDTCKMCWLVVQAAVNDLARTINPNAVQIKDDS